MIPLYLELHNFGMLNTYLGLIIPRAASAYGMFFMRSFYMGLPKSLEEAARIDGMSEFGIFTKIMFPLCKPAFVTFFIFCLTSNWNDLIYPLMMTNSTKMRTLSAGLAMFVGEGVRETGPALAGAGEPHLLRSGGAGGAGHPPLLRHPHYYQRSVTLWN